MGEKVICLDTSVLVEYFRKVKKRETFFAQLMANYDYFEITSVTAFELKFGMTPVQVDFWKDMLEVINVLPFDNRAAEIAVAFQLDLKKINKQLALSDLFIAASAKRHNRPLASLNYKHFERIKGIDLVFP